MFPTQSTRNGFQYNTVQLPQLPTKTFQGIGSQLITRREAVAWTPKRATRTLSPSATPAEVDLQATGPHRPRTRGGDGGGRGVRGGGSSASALGHSRHQRVYGPRGRAGLRGTGRCGGGAQRRRRGPPRAPPPRPRDQS